MSDNTSSGGFGITTLAALLVLAIGAITGLLYTITRGESWQVWAMSGWAAAVAVIVIVGLVVVRKHIADA